MREAKLERNTLETQIKLTLTLDQTGCGGFKGKSGIGFFDHMLNSFCVHGGFRLVGEIHGDLEVDAHHTVEDTGIVLGKLFNEILMDKSRIARFGTAFVPMDEALARAVVDISGRPFIVCEQPKYSGMIGKYDPNLNVEFFRALAYNALITLHIKAEYGENSHHITEAMFKAVGRALKQAVEPMGDGVLSAKGTLK